MVDKVRAALKAVRERCPELKVDGEMQFDAAMIPAIGQKKFPARPWPARPTSWCSPI
jgi:phosphate acetyltransferase